MKKYFCTYKWRINVLYREVIEFLKIPRYSYQTIYLSTRDVINAALHHINHKWQMSHLMLYLINIWIVYSTDSYFYGLNNGF